MEAALVTVSMGVMKPLLSKLCKLLEEEHAKIKGVGRQVSFLRDEMSTMSATLQMLSDAEELDPQMKDWRDTVRELSYDMEDCVDDFIAQGGLMGFFAKLKKLKSHHEIAGEIQKLKIRATEASERHKRYEMCKPTPGSGTSVTDPRLHALYVEVGKLVGIDAPKEHIIDWFKREGSSSQLKVVTVVGPAGLGKTTLANQVYRTIRCQFECTAFVSVSRKPVMKSVLREIAKEVGIMYTTLDDDVKQLIDRLREHLQNRRYLVVIDDLWDGEVWKTIKLALMDNDKGSRIITTTRNMAVASGSSSQGDYIYRMKPLSFIDSKRLFFNRVFGSEDLCYPHLEKVSDGILRKCAGLPLAIITLSGLLVDQNAEDEWNRVLAAIGSALAKDPNAENMTKILSFSYFDLPHHLRSALLYLSMFPEDHIIKKQLLIGRWIAEGFICEEQGRSAYEVGEVYFHDLINRGLIQPVDLEYGQANACRVHDIVLDFITCKAAEENFVTSFDASESVYVSDHRVRRLRVENQQATVSTTPVLSHVRSLTIFGNFVQISLLNFPALRVLDLGECSELESHHLADIEKLYLLKYLRLRLTSANEIPRKIGELKYLETLDLRGIEITELPPTITRLQRLSRLYVTQGTRFPSGVIGKLKNLEELEEFGVFSYEQGESLREFIQLTKLRTLKVAWGILWSTAEGGNQSDLQSYVAALVSSCNLHHLHVFSTLAPAPRRVLSLELWRLTTRCSLRKLHITHCYIGKVPKWMSSLGNLRELSLYIFSMAAEDVAVLGAIPTLHYLELSTFYGTKGRILIPAPGFVSLKYFSLQILRCGTLLQFEVGSMPKLDHLSLEFPAHNMKCLNGVSDFGIQHLSGLTKVEVIARGNFNSDHNSDPTTDTVTSLIKTTLEALPNRPTLSLLIHRHTVCMYFQEF